MGGTGMAWRRWRAGLGACVLLTTGCTSGSTSAPTALTARSARPPAAVPTVTPTPIVRGAAPTRVRAEPCAPTLSGRSYDAVKAGRLALASAVNHAVSATPDGAVLIDQQTLLRRSARSPQRLLLVNPEGSVASIWTAPNSRDVPVVDQDAAIGTRWVVFLIDHQTNDTAQPPAAVMAYNRRTRQLTMVGSTSAVYSTHGYADPVVVGDTIYWQSGNPQRESVTSEQLVTGHIIRIPSPPTITTLLVIGQNVVWQIRGRGHGRLHAVDHDDVPASVSAAVDANYPTSDGTAITWAALAANGNTEIRRWTVGSDHITRARFLSARGLLGPQLLYPYVETSDSNPGSSGQLQNVRSHRILQLTHALTLTLETGGYATLTSTTTQFGPTTVYRVRTNQLATDVC